MISAENKSEAIQIILDIKKPTGNRSRGQQVIDQANAIISYLEER